MSNTLRYKIFNVKNINGEIETHVEIEIKDLKINFNSGLITSQAKFDNYKNGIFSLDILGYLFQENYLFQLDWIEFLLNKLQIKSIVASNDVKLHLVENIIYNDIKYIKSSDSINYNLSNFLLNKYNIYIGNELDPSNPNYEEYTNYYHLMVCINRFQIENQLLIKKGNFDARLLNHNVNFYYSPNRTTNLQKYFKEFVDWSWENKHNLFSKRDINLIAKNKIY